MSNKSPGPSLSACGKSLPPISGYLPLLPSSSCCSSCSLAVPSPYWRGGTQAERRQRAQAERRHQTRPNASHESKAMIGAIQGSVSVVAIIQLMYVTSLPVFADQVLRYFGLHSANTRLRAATALSSLRQHVKHQRILRTAILTVLHMKVKVSDFQQTPDPGGRPQASTRHRPSRHLL